jgi:hypothetical protein
MSEPAIDKNTKGSQEVIDEIQMIRQETLMMGANDYEPSAFDSILERYQSGQLSAEEALANARQIQASKQDYH